MTATRALRLGARVALLGTIAAVCLLAIFVSARAAVVLLAATLAAAGALRAVLPSSVCPGARSRTFDVAFLLVLAAAFAYLGVWGDAPVAGS